MNTSVNRHLDAIKHRLPAGLRIIYICKVTFFVLLYPYQANGQKPANTYQTNINESIDNLNRWLHNGWSSAPARYYLRFQADNAALIYGKYLSRESAYKDHSEAGRNYSESYLEKPDGRLEKPKYPDFLISGFYVPAIEIDYKKLTYTAKRVIPSEEDNQQDWPYPIPPVVKVEIYSLRQKKSFAVAKTYRSKSGLYDSTVTQQVNKVDFHYPLYIRYHKELDGNPDKEYIKEAKKMLNKLFIDLELYSKSASVQTKNYTK